MSNSKKISVIVVLAILTILFGVMYFNTQKELIKTKTYLQTENINAKTLAFTKLFITKVLKANQEIDFDTRLGLENSVRDLGNNQILVQWQKFTDSKTEAQAQIEVKNLLEVLVNNINQVQ